jgi:endonuclease/exonuclease/phosphatase family metal-dependent hydrolase
MRIITWNIQWGRGCDGRVDLARVIVAAHATADFDVLCLQEVAVGFPGLPGGQGGDQLASLRGLLPDYELTFGIATDVRGEGGERHQFGNAILSRLPVRQVFRHLLPWPADPAVPSMQRIAVEAVIEAPWGPLRVVTSHLEYYSARQRLAQVEALRRLHVEASAHARDPRPGKREQGTPFDTQPRPASVVICGDFNFEPGSTEHAAMLAPMPDGALSLHDAWQLVQPHAPHEHTVGLHGAEWPDRPYCCDFFFVSECLAGRVLRQEVNSQTDASDHQPVLLELW